MVEKITCGRFTFDPETHEIEGPGNYMTDQGNALIDKILRGDDAVFNMTCHYSPTTEMAVLVRLQTDFAGWKGMKQFNSMRGVKKPNRLGL